jgi:hypothetical protein
MNNTRVHSARVIRIRRSTYSYFPSERSSSTCNLLALKIDRLRRASDHELSVLNALEEVTNERHSYGGNMLKKVSTKEVTNERHSYGGNMLKKVSSKPPRKKPRSKSIDGSNQYRVKHAS